MSDDDPFAPVSAFPHAPGAFLTGQDYLERGDARLAGRTRDEDHRRVNAQADQLLEHVARRRAELVPHPAGPDSSASTTSTTDQDDQDPAAFLARMNRERFAR